MSGASRSASADSLSAGFDRLAKAYLRFSGAVLRWAAMLLLSAMVAINATEVVWRAATGGGLGWTQELSIILAMALYFLCYALVAKDGEYIRVEILFNAFPAALQRPLSVLIRLVVIVFHGMVFWFTLWTMRFVGMFDTPVLQWPESVFYAPLAVGAFDIALTEVIRLIRPRLDPVHPHAIDAAGP
ncbi:MAG: TRAP transporter small permease subunit [Proteobacteria bacterium]|nr:TRAP transporter small permease subunit [Pseudomonadota bacterium]